MPPAIKPRMIAGEATGLPVPLEAVFAATEFGLGRIRFGDTDQSPLAIPVDFRQLILVDGDVGLGGSARGRAQTCQRTQQRQHDHARQRYRQYPDHQGPSVAATLLGIGIAPSGGK
jgi:hypothetical protein